MNSDNLFPKIISYLFHPLLLPSFGLLLIFNIDEMNLWFSSSEQRYFLYALTFTATFLLPLLNALLLLKMKQISSLAMETRQERKIPYLASAIFYFAESYFLMNADVPVLVKAMMFGATLLVVSVMLINLFWKISAHMVGIGGLCGMMLAISYRLQINLHIVLMLLFLIAGLVAFSRLKLNAHNSTQVYVGFLLGVSVQLILFL
ncbi:MAG: phosphatase PAP2 family protein [Bacteroidetes bacterium]|nr:phosphatase PAP2 family protein [Bacteroidota bacterium]